MLEVLLKLQTWLALKVVAIAVLCKRTALAELPHRLNPRPGRRPVVAIRDAGLVDPRLNVGWLLVLLTFALNYCPHYHARLFQGVPPFQNKRRCLFK